MFARYELVNILAIPFQWFILKKMYIFRPENRKDFCGRGSVARQPKKMSMKLFYPEAIQWKYQISSEKKKMIQINLAAEKIVLLSF